MALNTRLPTRSRVGPQRPKIHADENAIVTKNSITASARVAVKATTGPQRPALGEVTAAVNKREVKQPGKEKYEANTKAARSVAKGPQRPQRVPLAPTRVGTNGIVSSATTDSVKSIVNAPETRANLIQRPTSTRPPAQKALPLPEEDDTMEVEEELQEEDDFDRPEVALNDQRERVEAQMRMDEIDELLSEDELLVEDDRAMDEDTQKPARQWPEMGPETSKRHRSQVEAVHETFEDEVDLLDMTMVSEYSEEIFAYMSQLELETMPNPDYVKSQTEITWEIREVLVDWLLQVHLRYHMLPETLWIAVNIFDRFLTKRSVSLGKVQLVGVVALFIAVKYEEILAPTIDEFVALTKSGYSKEEIMKGERIILQTLDYKVSSYCTPYSWMRRISKADDYDIQTRTLSKFLIEVTLLDYRYLRVKPSLVAAIGMYGARKMLNGTWDDAFVFYSGFTEEHMETGFKYIVEKLVHENFEEQYVCRKYANKKFLKASVYAIQWARANQSDYVE